MARTVVFYDTEFTTWEGAMQANWSLPGQYRELVQIGAIRFDIDRLQEIDEFQILIKPVKNPVLSDFFTGLTGITNDHLALEAVPFPDAYHAFIAFVQGDMTSAYGQDDSVVRENLGWGGMPDGEDDFSSFNIGPWFMEKGAGFGIRPGVNSGKLASVLGAPMDGIQEHNALHDARSIAAAYRFLVQHGA
ncbi:MAG: 3'-5' exonuclease, partial [Bdellovibrionales bacterium]|nr:3'-5' exonuclease [Bdellovibrionales bacterium]